MHPPLRVAIATRHAIIRAGLSHLLDQHRSRVVVVPEVDERCPGADHDVAIHDLTRQPVGSREPGHALVLADKPVVALVPVDDAGTWARAQELGVSAVITMDVGADDLLAALETAAAKPGPSSAERRERSRVLAGSPRGLTDRQIDILELIADGMSNQQIAAKLYLSINTVKSNIRLAYKRIGVTSRSQAVLWALQHDLRPGPAHPPG